MSEQLQPRPDWRVHWDVALMFRQRGTVEVRAGHDLIGAELLWGAVARATKAVAEWRGWMHGRHGQLFTVARQLARASGRHGIWKRMLDANGLHVHFYESHLQRSELAIRVESAIAYVDAVESILRPGGFTD